MVTRSRRLRDTLDVIQAESRQPIKIKNFYKKPIMFQDLQFVFSASRVSLTSDKPVVVVVVFKFQSKFKIVVKVLNN